MYTNDMVCRKETLRAGVGAPPTWRFQLAFET